MSAPASPTISSTSSARVRDHRERAEGEGGVRRLVHDDVVGDLMDERLALGERASDSPCRLVGALQVEDVDRPVAGLLGEAVANGSEAARAAPRAASRAGDRAQERRQRRRARAPAPCVARGRAARPGLDVPAFRRRGGRRRSRRARRSRDGRRAELVQPLCQLRRDRRRPARANASRRFGVTTVAAGRADR